MRAAGSKAREAWLFIFALAMLLPWMLFDIVTGLAAAYAVSPAALLDLGWPVAAGLLIGWGLAASGLMASGACTALAGDPLMRLWDALDHAAPRSVQRLAGFETASRQWTTSSALLVLVMLVLTSSSSRADEQAEHGILACVGISDTVPIGNHSIRQTGRCQEGNMGKSLAGPCMACVLALWAPAASAQETTDDGVRL